MGVISTEMAELKESHDAYNSLWECKKNMADLQGLATTVKSNLLARQSLVSDRSDISAELKAELITNYNLVSALLTSLEARCEFITGQDTEA